MSPELGVEAGIPIYWSDGETTWQPPRNGGLEEGLREAVDVLAGDLAGDLLFSAGRRHPWPVGWIARLARSWRRRRDRRKPF